MDKPQCNNEMYYLQYQEQEPIPFRVGLLPRQGLRKVHEVLGYDANGPASRAVNVRYQEEGDGHRGRKNQKYTPHGGFDAVADEDVAAEGDGCHERPGLDGDAVPPGRLRVALRVQRVVHA